MVWSRIDVRVGEVCVGWSGLHWGVGPRRGLRESVRSQSCSACCSSELQRSSWRLQKSFGVGADQSIGADRTKGRWTGEWLWFLPLRELCISNSSSFHMRVHLPSLASSSAEWSMDKPPPSFIRRHESTMWDIIWVSATGAQVLWVC